VRTMTCLNWKSESVMTVIRPLQKGTGPPPKRHLRGKNFRKPGSIGSRLFRFFEKAKAEHPPLHTQHFNAAGIFS
jgi:hypothetical protein